jgi:hypothetical protein
MILLRHDIDIPVIQKYHAEHAADVPYFLAGARKKPDSLDLLINYAMATACSGVAVGLPLGEVKRLFCLAAQAYRALFLVVCAGGKKVTVPLGEGDPVTYETALDLSYLDPSRWLRAFFLGAVVRDDDLLEALMATPTDLIRQSTMKGPEFRYVFIDALRAFVEDYPQRRVRASVDLLLEAMKGTDPDRPDILNPDWVLHLDVPAIAVMFDILDRTPKLGDRLAWALEHHKTYWTSDPLKRLDWEGFLSLPLLGITSLAYEWKLRFEIESDYIPLPLIRKEA